MPCHRMSTSSAIENEVKIRISDPAAATTLLEKAGFRILKPRRFESNTVFDTPSRDLGARQELLRLRSVGDESILTFKGVPQAGPHKTREELETAVVDGTLMATILSRLHFEPAFYYEKYRTEYARAGEPGSVTLDETPIGDFLELEGPAAWLNGTAEALGFGASDYITRSYGGLYFDYCRERGIEPSGMRFKEAER